MMDSLKRILSELDDIYANYETPVLRAYISEIRNLTIRAFKETSEDEDLMGFVCLTKAITLLEELGGELSTSVDVRLPLALLRRKLSGQFPDYHLSLQLANKFCELLLLADIAAGTSDDELLKDYSDALSTFISALALLDIKVEARSIERLLSIKKR